MKVLFQGEEYEDLYDLVDHLYDKFGYEKILDALEELEVRCEIYNTPTES